VGQNGMAGQLKTSTQKQFSKPNCERTGEKKRLRKEGGNQSFTTSEMRGVRRSKKKTEKSFTLKDGDRLGKASRQGGGIISTTTMKGRDPDLVARSGKANETMATKKKKKKKKKKGRDGVKSWA